MSPLSQVCGKQFENAHNAQWCLDGHQPKPPKEREFCPVPVCLTFG